jgi:hypothetical protein
MSTLRIITDDMIYVGYYLSRLSDAASGEPPVGLGVADWTDAYDMFAPALADGRSDTQFRHTMENIRNAFDGFHDNPRPGWRIEGTDTQISEQCAACIVAHHTWNDDQLDLRAFQIAAGQGVWVAKMAGDDVTARVS